MQKLVKDLWDTVKADKIEKDLREYREKKLEYLKKGGGEKGIELKKPRKNKIEQDDDISQHLNRRFNDIQNERNFSNQRDSNIDNSQYRNFSGQERDQNVNNFQYQNSGMNEAEGYREEFEKERRKLDMRDPGPSQFQGDERNFEAGSTQAFDGNKVGSEYMGNQGILRNDQGGYDYHQNKPNLNESDNLMSRERHINIGNGL